MRTIALDKNQPFENIPVFQTKAGKKALHILHRLGFTQINQIFGKRTSSISKNRAELLAIVPVCLTAGIKLLTAKGKKITREIWERITGSSPDPTVIPPNERRYINQMNPDACAVYAETSTTHRNE